MYKQTYRTKGNSGSSQPYQPAVPRMRLMNGIGKLVTKLVEDCLDPGIVIFGDELANDAL
jgi:hypothetical protein